MGDIRFPDKPISNVFDYLYGESGGKIVKIHSDNIKDEYDAVLVVFSSLTTNPIPYVESGSVKKIFEKCKNKEMPKVLLKYAGGTGSYILLFEPITATCENNESYKTLVLSFKSTYSEEGAVFSGEYVITYNNEYAIENGECSEHYYLNTGNNLNDKSINYDLVINSNESEEDIGDAYVFDLGLAYELWEKVNAGQNVSVLIKGKTYLDSTSTVYPAQFHSTNVMTYGTKLIVCYMDVFNGGLFEIHIEINESSKTGIISRVNRKWCSLQW